MAKLEPHFTFENFVVGPANRLAAAAARRASERPGASYNPLFIHAPAGMGKTHLLGAIADHVKAVYPDKKVEYQTAGEFLDELAGESGVADGKAVLERYEDLGILLLDEIHLITANPEHQDFLIQTLDLLTGEGKQVVLASRHPPSQLDGLGAHLRTRFEDGLMVDIGSPGYETRVAIIRKRLEIRLQVLQSGVPDAIGRIPFPSVQALDEALTQLINLQEKEDRTLSPEEAEAILEAGVATTDGPGGAEVGQFLDELSDTVAEKVEAQEVPWRRTLREASEAAEKEGFNAAILRRLMDQEVEPAKLSGIIEEFQAAVERLKEIEALLDAAGNPWPEAAHGILSDPAQVKEAEVLLAAAQERGKSFPEVPPGPNLDGLGGELPKLVVQAAHQLVYTGRPEYNPLYVWSRDGIAPRALLHAAARSATMDEGASGVALISVATFAEEFVRSLSTGLAGAWRERWWTANIVLIDGIQELSEALRAQEELFHLLDAIRRRGARIMFGGDRAPGDILDLDERLRAVLEAGVVVEVEVDGSALSPGLLESLKEPEAEPPSPPEADHGRDVVTEDLEWIRSFQPKGPDGHELLAGVAPGEESPVPATLAEADAGPIEEEGRPKLEWVPSPEQVILEWPRFEERVAEDFD